MVDKLQSAAVVDRLQGAATALQEVASDAGTEAAGPGPGAIEAVGAAAGAAATAAGTALESAKAASSKAAVLVAVAEPSTVGDSPSAAAVQEAVAGAANLAVPASKASHRMQLQPYRGMHGLSWRSRRAS